MHNQTLSVFPNSSGSYTLYSAFELI